MKTEKQVDKIIRKIFEGLEEDAVFLSDKLLLSKKVYYKIKREAIKK